MFGLGRIFQVDIEGNNGVPLSHIERLFSDASLIDYTEGAD